MAKAAGTVQRATATFRVVGGVLRLRPTKRGIPFADDGADGDRVAVAHGSERILPLVAPRGASTMTTSASRPGLRKPLLRP